MRRPFVHLNFALLDNGQMTGEDGQQVPISCDQDWERVHLLRESYDAVAVGARTWINDEPRLTARREILGREPCQQPARVIFAGGWDCEVGEDPRRTFVVGQRPAAVGLHVSCADHGLSEPLRALRENSVESMLVEGGATLLRSFFDQEMYDLLTIYVATENLRKARESMRLCFPWLPALSASRLGKGTLLTYRRENGAGRNGRGWSDREVQELLQNRLTYLKVGGAPGERLAVMGPMVMPLRAPRGNRAAPDANDEPHRRFDWYVFGRVPAGEVIPRGQLANSVLVCGRGPGLDLPLVRLHSGCQTGDIFSSMRCDCGAQFDRSLAAIAEEGQGVAVYLAEHEGRGIGLWAKAAAYLLQEQGADTYEANRRLGYPEDNRTYEDAAAVLRYVLKSHQLDDQRIRLLSNNPAKREAMAAYGFEVVEMRQIVAGHNEINRRYLAAKTRHGHLLSLSSNGEDDSACEI